MEVLGHVRLKQKPQPSDGPKQRRRRIKILQFTDVHRWPHDEHKFELENGKVIEIDEKHYRFALTARQRQLIFAVLSSWFLLLVCM